MRVIVVGGGIGGLGAAIALGRGGHDVVVLEQAPRLDPVGAGITLFANAMAALERLGVGSVVRRRGSAARRSAILTDTGRQLTALPTDLLHDAVAIHRGDLQAALLRASPAVRLGAEVASVQVTPDGVTAALADQSEEVGELLVGADGLRSVVRPSVAPSAPCYGGYTAWRGISQLGIESGRLTESWGMGERFGLVDIKSRTYWFATANVAENQAEDPHRRKATLIDRFSHWHPPITDVLEATPESAILRNDVYFLKPLARWSRERIVLVGDAAHATTPGIGQGAAQALEDAVVLACEIERHNRLEDALERYEAIRRPRAELALKLSRQADRVAQLDNPAVCRVRDAVARLTPERLQRRRLAPLIHHRLDA
jgi:2-polyprenyl-6-methoxyphenol hydroxylase-like FAD-dependent oxidoreductase